MVDGDREVDTNGQLSQSVCNQGAEWIVRKSRRLPVDSSIKENTRYRTQLAALLWVFYSDHHRLPVSGGLALARSSRLAISLIDRALCSKQYYPSKVFSADFLAQFGAWKVTQIENSGLTGFVVDVLIYSVRWCVDGSAGKSIVCAGEICIEWYISQSESRLIG